MRSATHATQRTAAQRYSLFAVVRHALKDLFLKLYLLLERIAELAALPLLESLARFELAPGAHLFNSHARTIEQRAVNETGPTTRKTNTAQSDFHRTQ